MTCHHFSSHSYPKSYRLARAGAASPSPVDYNKDEVIELTAADVAHLKQVSVYTDGACSGNPGPGGWAAILTYKGKEKELSGGEAHTTNQRMEITAVYEALCHMTEPCDVVVYSDSAYVINCFKQKWYVNWRRNGWMNSKGEPVQNRDLWEKLLEQTERHRVRFEKVKGHAGDVMNERCDQLARAAVPS